jgi:hypothetical protein
MKNDTKEADITMRQTVITMQKMRENHYGLHTPG